VIKAVSFTRKVNIDDILCMTTFLSCSGRLTLVVMKCRLLS